MTYHSNHQPRDVPIEPEEFEEFKRQCRQEGIEWTEHLINLRQRLPYHEGCLNTRALVEQNNREWLDKKPEYDPERPERNYSETLRGQTWREFYAEIDQALQELGLHEQVQALNSDRYADLGKLCELIYPLYVKLRERGYNCYPDLTA